MQRHGAWPKICEADLGRHVFVGFNSFLRGRPDARLAIGDETIVMPHTIIDSKKPLEIPAGRLVWGMIRDQEDLKTNSIAIDKFSTIDSSASIGGRFPREAARV